ncbi:MAG: GDP-L-fucose synthase [Acholeplasmataceae bacterium]|jgi:GDP-L-fucose synthase|nr:GDP-L-fucose synthase [Acholeplasmataceae bacterium]
MDKDSKIYVAGHKGMVGSAIWKKLNDLGYKNLLGATSRELDLTVQANVDNYFKTNKPDYVFIAAAKVGGIFANNTYPAEFIYSNLTIQTNIIHSSYKYGVKKLLFLGSSCIYPRLSEQPIKEEYLLSGYLEPTNEAYAIAKIAGIEMCKFYRRQYGCNFISVMPTNLYGINDNFDPATSHVLPALIRKIHEAKTNNLDSVTIWGSGKPRREFLYVDDLAEACIHLMNIYNDEIHVNIGCGEDLSIIELAKLIADVVGYKGLILTDTTKPDGTPRKLLDTTLLRSTGWFPKTSLEKGINVVYDWFVNNNPKTK